MNPQPGDVIGRGRPALRPLMARRTRPIHFSRSRSALLALLSLAVSAFALPAGVDNTIVPDGQPHSFTFGGPDHSQFLLDGTPFQIRSAEIHPQRIPPEYWRHRLRQARAMGLNTISIYLMWAGFEQPDGTFDFQTGGNQLGKFLETCREEKIWVLLRPGPYVCAEWDFGGIPNRLLKDPDARIRTLSDRNYLAGATAYLKRVAEICRPHQARNGGPILMVALDNEFGSWPRRQERNYLEWLRDFWKTEGFGPFFTCDGPSDAYLAGVTLPGVAVGLDPGENEEAFACARKHAVDAPVFCSEIYPGWLRHWGEGNWEPSDKTAVVDWLMKQGYSFSFYVLQGGTSFGFTAGANNFGTGFEPSVTSYDFGAPLDEQGRVTKAFHDYRAVIARHLPPGSAPPPVEPDIPALDIPAFTPVRIAGLWDRVPARPFTRLEQPACFESFDQNQGMAVYTTTVPAGPAARLQWTHLHDYAHFYLDGRFLGPLDRRVGPDPFLTLPARDAPAELEILVESMGHINYTTHKNSDIGMEFDRKGLFGPVTLAGAPLTGWSIRALPLLPSDLVGADPVPQPSSRRGSHFRATFTLEDAPKDTFFDMSRYGKGVVWVNGRNLGRYWHVGPQFRLYCPAGWLKQGENVIDILDLEKLEPGPIRGCRERNFGPVNRETRNLDNQW
ncbi:MAG: beta-galactosidase [Kiritimatiellia bacterium]